jgi:hypothetical protein
LSADHPESPSLAAVLPESPPLPAVLPECPPLPALPPESPPLVPTAALANNILQVSGLSSSNSSCNSPNSFVLGSVTSELGEVADGGQEASCLFSPGDDSVFTAATSGEGRARRDE